jgi:hypothetical protein
VEIAPVVTSNALVKPCSLSVTRLSSFVVKQVTSNVLTHRQLTVFTMLV